MALEAMQIINWIVGGLIVGLVLFFVRSLRDNYLTKKPINWLLIFSLIIVGIVLMLVTILFLELPDLNATEVSKTTVLINQFAVISLIATLLMIMLAAWQEKEHHKDIQTILQKLDELNPQNQSPERKTRKNIPSELHDDGDTKPLTPQFTSDNIDDQMNALKRTLKAIIAMIVLFVVITSLLRPQDTVVVAATMFGPLVAILAVIVQHLLIDLKKGSDSIKGLQSEICLNHEKVIRLNDFIRSIELEPNSWIREGKLPYIEYTHFDKAAFTNFVINGYLLELSKEQMSIVEMMYHLSDGMNECSAHIFRLINSDKGQIELNTPILNEVIDTLQSTANIYGDQYSELLKSGFLNIKERKAQFI